jgi:hypothetical protein
LKAEGIALLFQSQIKNLKSKILLDAPSPKVSTGSNSVFTFGDGGASGGHQRVALARRAG